MTLRMCTVLALVAFVAGCNLDGATGDGRYAGCYDNSCVDTPQAVPGVPAFVAIAAGGTHACGLTSGGDAWCWGDNFVGQLGDGTNVLHSAPQQVAGDAHFTAISVGNSFTCALTDAADVYCWGLSQVGQAGRIPMDSAPTVDRFACGVGRIPCARTPLLVASGLKSVAAGARHACGVTIAGEAVCWGLNTLGDVGRSDFDAILLTPYKIPGSSGYASIYAGAAFTCALTTAGKPYCWGDGGRGQLGDVVPLCRTVAGFQEFCSSSPIAVRNAATYSKLSLSTSRACGIAPGGAAHCWGDGNGELGSSTNPARADVAVSGTYSVFHDAGGATCATPVTGPSVCWGINTYGRLGIGERAEVVSVPRTIVGSRVFTAFASGDSHVCALDASGAAWCWGAGGLGQLGTAPRSP